MEEQPNLRVSIPEKKDWQQEMINDLLKFMVEKNLTGSDLRGAYLIALDSSVPPIGHAVDQKNSRLSWGNKPAFR